MIDIEESVYINFSKQLQHLNLNMLKTAFFFQVEQIEWVDVKGLSTWDFAMETWKKYTIKIDDIQFGIIKIITQFDLVNYYTQIQYQGL